MNIFVELPTWLGDAVMASMAIENLAIAFSDAKITFFGAPAALQLYQNHPSALKLIPDDSRKHKFRPIFLANTFRHFGKFDIAVSFRSSLTTKFAFIFLNADKKIIFNKHILKAHQALKYNEFIKQNLSISTPQTSTILHFLPKFSEQKILGLNPGANYGSAKRWEPEYFADIGLALCNEYKIVIFGSKNESEICNKIAEILTKKGVKFENLCGKTDIKALCEKIGSTSLFITGDSGPMHIAAAFGVKTIALFGPTKDDETSPFKNPHAIILRAPNIACAPCMKRVCPIKTHICMKNLTPQMVLEQIKQLQ